MAVQAQWLRTSAHESPKIVSLKASQSVVNNRLKAYTSPMSVEFTQAQVRKVLGIAPETFRHWQRVLPPLRKRARRQPLAHGDILALETVRVLVREVGVNSSAVALHSEAIFNYCNSNSWPALAQSRIQLTESGTDLVSQRAPLPTGKRLIVILQLAPLVDELSQRLLGNPSHQPELKFPLVAVRSGRR